MKITLAKGGTKERVIDVNKIRIPDMWHVAMRCENKHDIEMVLEYWYLAIFMKQSLQEISRKGGE